MHDPEEVLVDDCCVMDVRLDCFILERVPVKRIYHIELLDVGVDCVEGEYDDVSKAMNALWLD